VAKGERQLDPSELAVTLRERAFALILAALVRQDATGDVELAWKVAEMVASLEVRQPPER
jgi:hypothetical protein